MEGLTILQQTVIMASVFAGVLICFLIWLWVLVDKIGWMDDGWLKYTLMAVWIGLLLFGICYMVVATNQPTPVVQESICVCWG